MPSFNHERYVAEALRSVYDQTYPDIEFIIIDDCSADGTMDVIQKVARHRKFIRRFRRLSTRSNLTNEGAHLTLNAGLDAAAGEFVTFINSDDVYEPNRIEMITASCQSRHVPFLAFSSVKLLSTPPVGAGFQELKTILEHGPERFREDLPSLSFAFLRHQLTGSTGNIFTNRNLLDEVGGFAVLNYCHDWDFMLRAVAITEPVFVEGTSYRYRIHASNSFGRLQGVAIEESAAVLGNFFKRIASGNVRNRQAPTPFNWPHVFDMIARRFEVYDAWIAETKHSTLYARRQAALFAEVPVNRTVRKTLAARELI